MFFLKYIVNYLRRHYNIDRGPEFVEALRKINRPSEVTVPNELIPAGALMHLRGLFNLHALSINNDWVWPYWIEQQFNPRSPSFIPRAMSFSYINLTHRNWTGVGVLGGTREAVVDPRGAVMPWEQGWSLDTYVQTEGELHVPSRILDDRMVRQALEDNLPMVRTEFAAGKLSVRLRDWAFRRDDQDFIAHEATLLNPTHETLEADLVFSLRPYNPEGLSLLKNLAYNTKGFWVGESSVMVFFPERPDRSVAANHEAGDVVLHLNNGYEESSAHCDVGLATAASVFRVSVPPGQSVTRHAVMPLAPHNPRFFPFSGFEPEALAASHSAEKAAWTDKLQQGLRLELPDSRYQECFDANRAFLLLLNDGHEITAGPMTYHRHWFRDSAYLLNGLTKLGYAEEVSKILRFFPTRQWKNGYFCSQKGEWDSNGQAIWAIMEHYRHTGDRALLESLYPAIRKAVQWIEKKRHDISVTPQKPKGLLPAGFSAEHLGPNDYYYWDNFWSLRGMLDAAAAARALGREAEAGIFDEAARRYRKDLEESIARESKRTRGHVLPAAPRRRPDAGMIGNICACYPLDLYPSDTVGWMRETVGFIRDHLFHDDGFFQHMIHSGINTYLTMQMAQCLLRLDDFAAFRLTDYILGLASPTWCWPEAIHPQTRGGCMGDGHHGWAAAEWVLLMRNFVLREDGDALEITRLVPAEWCIPGKRIAAHSAPTEFGTVDVAVEFSQSGETVTVNGNWRRQPREIRWFLPAEGRRVLSVDGGEVKLEGRVAVLGPTVRRVALEVDLTQAHSASEAVVPGL